MTVSKSLMACLLLALPWWIGTALGPVAQIGAWAAASLVIAGLLISQSLRAWPLSLVLAAGKSHSLKAWRLACHAKMQHHGFFQAVDFCWREGGDALLESFFVCGHDLV